MRVIPFGMTIPKGMTLTFLLMKPLALVIEDAKDQAVLFSQALEWAGYETEIAHDGLEGLKRLSEHIPHLVLLDLHIPKVSGEDVFEHIKDNPCLKDTKVVLATGDSSLAEKLNDGVDLVLLKPIDMIQLRDLAARLMD
jgi:CheY-like chemotaxis protein